MTSLEHIEGAIKGPYKQTNQKLSRKDSLYSDGQQFHQYYQNKQPPFASMH